MRIEDVIEGLNKRIINKREELNIKVKGHLVLQKEIITDTTFKAYKTYTYTLWLVGHKNYRVITLSLKDRVLSGQEAILEDKLNRYLIDEIFNLVLSEKLQKKL